MRVGLTARLTLATGFVAVVVTTAFAVLFLAMMGVHHARDMAVHSADESYVVRDVRRMLVDMETADRGFIISGEQSFLDPWTAARQQLPESFTTLRNIADDPGQAARAEQLESDALSYVNDYSVPLVDAAAAERPG